MTAYHAVELLLVASAIGAAAWHVYRRWRRRPSSGAEAACGACDKCAPPRD